MPISHARYIARSASEQPTWALIRARDVLFDLAQEDSSFGREAQHCRDLITRELLNRK